MGSSKNIGERPRVLRILIEIIIYRIQIEI